MKHFAEMEDYFLPAKSGDPIAYKELYEAFVKEGLVVFKNFCFNFLIYNTKTDDVVLVLSELFVKVMKFYRKSYGSFINYSNIAILRTVRNYCFRELTKPEESMVSLDTIGEDGISLIEQIPSIDYTCGPRAIAIKDSIYTIASKSQSKNREEKKIAKVMLYRINGYSYEEICKKLKLSLGQLRAILSKIKEDSDYSQLKIDLK